MYKKLILALFLIGFGSLAYAKNDDCRSVMLDFLSESQKQENLASLPGVWTPTQKKQFLKDTKELAFSDADIKLMIESLNMQVKVVKPARVRSYLAYVLTLSDKNQKAALMDLAQLDATEVNSKHIVKFTALEEKVQAKMKAKKLKTPEEKKRYQELFYGCRALRPNDVNRSAARDFKRFNLALNLGTLAASYSYYNMDKDLDGEWFGKLGYDIGMTLFFSYVGGNIQTKATDTQIVKSLKSYLMGRVLSVTDIAVYDPIFNNERELAEKRIEELKKDPDSKAEVEKLLKMYNERGLYRQYKSEIIETLKKLPDGISLGVSGNSVDENNVDWNNLSHADMDRPEVQEVLVAAAMAQIYEESKGDWVDTGDAGLDRYAFNTVFYGLQIPKSIIQNFITYKMLCMGQDNPKLAFGKAVLFNVSANFMVNQLLYGYREKAINQ